MKNKIVWFVAAAFLVGGAAGFFGGMKYQQGKVASNAGGARNFQNLTDEQRQQLGANFQGGDGMANGNRNIGNGSGMASGEVISKDDKSITLKLRDGGSKIIFYSGSTKFTKSAEGEIGDVAVGEQISATGSANSDGSLTAQTIQIRPIIQIGAQPSGQSADVK